MTREVSALVLDAYGTIFDVHSVARVAESAGVGEDYSEATVKSYLLRIYRSLGARDRASAVAEGYRRGLLQ